MLRCNTPATSRDTLAEDLCELQRAERIFATLNRSQIQKDRIEAACRPLSRAIVALSAVLVALIVVPAIY